MYGQVPFLRSFFFASLSPSLLRELTSRVPTGLGFGKDRKEKKGVMQSSGALALWPSFLVYGLVNQVVWSRSLVHMKVEWAPGGTLAFSPHFATIRTETGNHHGLK